MQMEVKGRGTSFSGRTLAGRQPRQEWAQGPRALVHPHHSATV